MPRVPLPLRALALLLTPLAGCDDPCGSRFAPGESTVVVSGPVELERTVIDAGMCGPAWVAAADLDGDAAPELILSRFGVQTGASVPNGSVTTYDLEGDTWSTEVVLSEDAGQKWPNDADAHDMDADGDLDLLVGFGFLTCQLVPWTSDCGGLTWFENGADWARHDLVPNGADGFFHRAVSTDVDGDGRLDLVATRESLATPFGSTTYAQMEWFAGSDQGFVPQSKLVDGGGSLPVVFDVDGDGDEDIATGEFFVETGGFVWFEKEGAEYTRHVISTDHGPAIQLSIVPDLFGDGAPVVVGSNHVNNAEGSDQPWQPGILAWRIPDDPKGTWETQVLADDFESLPGTGVAAPGVFSYGDIDGDGDIDLLVSGDGDVSMYWLEQVDGVFDQHVLEAELPTAGGNAVTDLDGDGAADLIVVGYEDNALLRYEVR